MAKTTSVLRANAGELAGIQKEERTMSALPIRIDYQHPQTEHSCTPVGSDFRFAPIRTGVPPTVAEYDEHISRMMQTSGHSLDPFAVRDAFEAVSDVPSALRFLSEAGIFWQFGEILWSQFREWQRFFCWLRQPHEKAVLSQEGAKAWRTAEGWKNEFFTEILRFPVDAMREIGPEKMREIEIADRRRLGDLRRFALWPGRATGDCVSIQWHEVSDKTFKRCPPTRRFKGQDQKPFLSIEVRDVVEAIAATIYADRCHGIDYEACKKCGRLFKVESNHGQEFCPAPARLQSSPCKNAYQAQVRRDKLKAARAVSKLKRKPR